MKFIALHLTASLLCGLISFYIMKSIVTPKYNRVPTDGPHLLNKDKEAKGIFENNFVDTSSYEKKGQDRLDSFVHSDSNFEELPIPDLEPNDTIIIP